MGLLLLNSRLLNIKTVSLLKVYKAALCKCISNSALKMNFSEWQFADMVKAPLSDI